MIDAPQASVLMAVYNSEEYLTKAIDSILGQTLTDFEFLIIDDGSTDKSREIILSYSDSRIRLINNETNIGLTRSLNKGLDLALGKYIVRMDADDISLPDRLKIQFEFMEKNPHIDVCGSWYALMGHKNSISKPPLQNIEIKETLFFHNCIAHPAVIIRKNILDKYQIKYNGEYPYSQDYELWCREINRLTFANIPKILIQYRIHDNQTGILKKRKQDEIADQVRIKNLENLSTTFSEKEQKMFCDIVRNNFTPHSKSEIFDALTFLDKMGTQVKNRFSPSTVNKIKNYMRKYSENGISIKRTSLVVFLKILLKWDIYPSPRSKARYVYHSIKNLIN